MKLENISKFLQDYAVKGFLAEDEGEALYRFALESTVYGPCLEVGSYCGKSSLYIASACKQHNSVLYAVDHHKGSEEHQFGEEYFDADLYDEALQVVNSFPIFQRNIRSAELDDVVIPLVAYSALASRYWQTPLGFVFIDGGHSPEMSMSDCVDWSNKLAVGGIIAIHDIFSEPEQGGQGPYWAMQELLNGGNFENLGKVNSLGILKKIK